MSTTWPGWLHLDGWEGRTKQPVIVVGETPKRFRIATTGPEPVRLAGPRVLGPNRTALVPKYAVTRRTEAGKSKPRQNDG